MLANSPLSSPLYDCLADVAFFTNSPLPSPLLSFVLPMMILSNPLHDMDYELMINTCEELGIYTSRPYYISSLSLL
jgi:hypothetical protein